MGLNKAGFSQANARGKPHRSTKCGGYQQAELVGVGLTNLLGWGAKAGCCTSCVNPRSRKAELPKRCAVGIPTERAVTLDALAHSRNFVNEEGVDATASVLRVKRIAVVEVQACAPA